MSAGDRGYNIPEIVHYLTVSYYVTKRAPFVEERNNYLQCEV